MRFSYPKSRILLLAAVAVVSSYLWAIQSPVLADETSDQFLTTFGGSTYRVYCANCHGENGQGDGQVAAYLRKKPTDLTRIEMGEDGKFPTEKLVRVIDGREEIKLHGSREMPIWGDALSRPGPNPEAAVDERIKGLVIYLRSIQQK